MRIAGLDISRNSATVCILEEIPRDFKKIKTKKLKLDKKGIETFLSLEFDIAILEPTGGHYSRLWAHNIERSGRRVLWVDHHTVDSHRRSHRLINKSDGLDAAILAVYGLERLHVKGAFLEPQKLSKLNDLVLQTETLNRIKNPIVNRLRQQLCHEWPEASEKKTSSTKQPSGLWLAISGEKWSAKFKAEYNETCGLGLSSFSEGLAKLICEVDRQKTAIEQAIAQEMKSSEYEPYLRAMAIYGINPESSTAASLMLAIYPFERFLDGERRVIKDHVTTVNGKRASRNRSLAAFKMACGLGMTWFQSGDSEGWRPGGRAVTRRAIWRWVKISVVMNPDMELKAIATLREYYEGGVEREICDKSTGFTPKIKHLGPGIRNQRVMRVGRRFLEGLFKELAREMAID